MRNKTATQNLFYCSILKTNVLNGIAVNVNCTNAVFCVHWTTKIHNFSQRVVFVFHSFWVLLQPNFIRSKTCIVYTLQIKIHLLSSFRREFGFDLQIVWISQLLYFVNKLHSFIENIFFGYLHIKSTTGCPSKNENCITT